MLILKDFYCKICGRTFERMVKNNVRSQKCDCGRRCPATISVPKLEMSKVESFNPHYDYQLGEHFESAEHKMKVLEKLGKIQLGGTLSPRRSSKDRILCTREQAARHFGFAVKKEKSDVSNDFRRRHGRNGSTRL